MNKNLKNYFMISLATTTCIVISVILLAFQKPKVSGGVDNGVIQAIAEEQVIQKEEIATMKKEYDEKMEIQIDLLKEYDVKLTEHDELNKTMQTNIDNLTKKIQETQTQVPIEIPIPEPMPVEPPPDVVTQNEPVTPQTVTANSVDGVNLRDAQTSTGNRVELVPNNTVMTIIEGPYANEGYNWYKVSTPAGNQGWVAKEFTR